VLILHWKEPVRTGGALITGPLEAHQFLMSGWPNQKDMAFALAENAILAALDGRKTAEEARSKFLAAVRSAQLL